MPATVQAVRQQLDGAGSHRLGNGAVPQLDFRRPMSERIRGQSDVPGRRHGSLPQRHGGRLRSVLFLPGELISFATDSLASAN